MRAHALGGCLAALCVMLLSCRGAVAQQADKAIYRPQDPQRLFAAPPRLNLPLLSIPGTAQQPEQRGDANSTHPPQDAAAEPTAENATPFIDLSQPQTLAGSPSDAGIDQDMLINFVVWMVVILCLCGLTVLGIRMLQRRGIIKAGSAGPSSGQARVVDSLSLGRNQFVQLLEIGGRQVLVASDTSGIREMVPLSSEFDASLLDATSELEDAA